MARVRGQIQLKTIPIDKIEMPDVPLDQDLMGSLSEVKQKDPIKVVPNGDMYRVNSGKRRVKALIESGAKTVLALVVYDIDDLEFSIQALVSNAGKANPMDEADHMMVLLDEGYNQKQIAIITGYSQSRVSQTLKLKTWLCPSLQQKTREGEINFKTALEATKLPLDIQQELVGKITYKSVFESVRNYQASFMPELDIENEVEPGLFLTAKQVLQLLRDEPIKVNWKDRILEIQLIDGYF